MKLRYHGWVYRRAEEVDPKKEVEKIEESPGVKWKDYLQPIIATIRSLDGLEKGSVSLVGPYIVNPYGSPLLGFSIEGHVKYKEGAPARIIEEYGEPPYRFVASITSDGELLGLVEIHGSKG